MNELEKIINKYFNKDGSIITYYELKEETFLKITDPNNIFHYEAPDILSIFDNYIIAIEHFEFDSFSSNRKGSDYKIKENNIKKEIDKEVIKSLKKSKSSINHAVIKSSATLENYYNNFQQTFLTHYKKINQYRSKIENDYGTERDIVMCFFAEDSTPLGNYFLDRESSNNLQPLTPLYSDEIIEMLIKHNKVQYLILGVFALNEYKVIVFKNDKETLKKFKKNRSHINITKNNFVSLEPQITSFHEKIDITN